MQNSDQSSRFQEVTNVLITMDNFNVQSSAYSSFIDILSHLPILNPEVNQSEVFNSNISWAFSKVFSLSDEKSRERLFLVIIDILLNLKYTNPGSNNDESEDLLSATFNRVYKRVGHRLQLVRYLSQYQYILKGEDGYEGSFNAYEKLLSLLRKLYSMCGTYSIEDTNSHSSQSPQIASQQDELAAIKNIIINSQTINSIFIMSVFSERFSSLRAEVYEKVKSNIKQFLANPNQMMSSVSSNNEKVSIPGYVFIAINFLATNYALKYVKDDDLSINSNANNENEDNNDSFSVDKLKIVIERLFQTDSPFVWQCTLYFLLRAQTFFKPEKALSLFSPAIVRRVQSLFLESETSTKICFELASSIPAIIEDDNQDNNSNLFTKQAQLSSLFSSMASVITDYKSDYIQKLTKFANDRKDEPNFKPIIGMLPSKNETYKAGIVIGVALKMINNNDRSDDTFIRKCFYDYFNIVYESKGENNQIPVQILQSIPYCVQHGSINEGNIDIIANSVISILCIKNMSNYPIQKEIYEYLPEALNSLSNSIGHVFNCFISHVSQFSSVYELEVVCDYLNEKFANQPNLDQNSGFDYNQAYCVTVATLLRFILAQKVEQRTKTSFIKFIQMFASKIGHEVNLKTDENGNITDASLMHNSARFISIFVPSRMTSELLNQSFNLMNQEKDLSFAVVCAGIPGVDEKRMKVLIEKVHSSLNPELFATFYEGRVAISTSGTLKELYEYTKSSTTGWFKKTPSCEFYQCIIETVTVLLENLTLQEHDMIKLMKILELSLPTNEDLLFKVRNQAKKMIMVMSMNPDAKPKEKFLDTLIGTPLYADSIPGLISKVAVDNNRIKDAIRAWALHTFKDPLLRKANPMFVESIFKYSTDPATLNTIINIIVDYMGSPTTTSDSPSEKDPISAIELALAAAEIAEARNIKYTDYSIELIMKCAEYCLSPGNELRTATIRFLINLFALIIPLPQQDESNPLSNYGNQMSPNDITAAFMTIFSSIFKIMGEKICLLLFDKAVTSNPLKLHHVMLIRALLAVHSNAFVELRVTPLLKLCSFKASKMDPVILFQIERSILFFASENTPAFTRFLCQIPMNELTTLCVNRIMMKDELRNQFINEYAKILSITSHTYYLKNVDKKENDVYDLTNTKCGLYQLLGIISSADVNMDCMGRILTCILIWLGLFYFNRMLKISSSSFSSELKTISSIFSNLVKTNGNTGGGFFSSGSGSSSSLMSDQQINFVIHDLDNFISCLQIAADQILNSIDVVQFDTFIDTSIKAVETGSDAAIIAIGIVFIQLLQRFSFYNSELSKSFRLKIAEVLSKCFNRTNTTENAENQNNLASSGNIFIKGVVPTRILAYTLNSSINLPMLNELSALHQSHILKNVMDSCLTIRDKNEFLVKSIFDLTCWLILNVNESVINSEKERIPKFASSFFNLSEIKYLPPSVDMPVENPKKDLILTVGIIDVLGYMVKNGIEFIAKMGKTRLNFVNLLLLMVTGNQRADIQEKISDVLKRLTSSKSEDEMIVKIIKNSLDKSEIKALCGNLINICTTPEGMMIDIHYFTERYLNTLLCVYNETKGYRDEISPFHAKAFKIFVRVVSVYGGVKEEDLQEHQKSIIQLSLNALNQM